MNDEKGFKSINIRLTYTQTKFIENHVKNINQYIRSLIDQDILEYLNVELKKTPHKDILETMDDKI
jgi:hypothetical protein